MVKDVVVLRYGHRRRRDARVSTHCCLVARALGVSQIVLCGEKDDQVKKEVEEIVKRWGGKFKVGLGDSWKQEIKKHQAKGFKAVHLTMYGLPVQKEIKKIRKLEKILVIVGGRKVPGDVYKISDFNLAVSNQPHSEIAALAVFLHALFQGKELEKKFPNAELRIVPQAQGKKVLKR